MRRDGEADRRDGMDSRVPDTHRATPRASGARRPEAPPHHWTFLSNHAHVLICLAQEPQSRLRDVAARIGITERAVSTIIRDLEEEGLLTRHREGRRNTYRLSLDQPLRHPVERQRTVKDLVGLLLD